MTVCFMSFDLYLQSFHRGTSSVFREGKADGMYTGYYLMEDGQIYGPDGRTPFCFTSEGPGAPDAEFPYYTRRGFIYGPEGKTGFYVHLGYIYGPTKQLPWLTSDSSGPSPQ